MIAFRARCSFAALLLVAVGVTALAVSTSAGEPLRTSVALKTLNCRGVFARCEDKSKLAVCLCLCLGQLENIGSTFKGNKCVGPQVSLRRSLVKDSYKASQRLYGKFAQFAPAWITWRRSKRRRVLCQKVSFAVHILESGPFLFGCACLRF